MADQRFGNKDVSLIDESSGLSADVIVRSDTNNGLAVETGLNKIVDTLGNSISAFPATYLRVTDEPHQLFLDSFDSALDTTDRWTSTSGNSGVAASVTNGVMSMGTGTVANGYAKLVSQPTFPLTIPAWLGASDAIALPDGAAPTSNSYRYWGTGTTPGTPSVATPVTDGYGFELGTDGKLRAVVYAGGTRTVVQDLSSSGNSKQPLDANYHRYIILIRTDKSYWYIDGITSAQLVATADFISSRVQGLPRLFLTIGNSTPPVSNTQIQCTGAAAWDTGKNSHQLSDGTFAWRKATISPTGALSTVMGASATTGAALATFRNAALSNTAVSVKASAGKIHWYNLFNPGVTLAYLHFYDLASGSVSVGSTTPTLSIALPSNATASIGLDNSINQGLNFAAAISIAASTTPTGGTAPATALVVNLGYI